MSKLFKLKKWLTLPDAAKHLSIVFGEEVTEADILRLSLDEHLKLSVHLVNGAVARRGKVVNLNQAQMYLLPTDSKGLSLDDLMPHFLRSVTLEDNLPEAVKKELDDKKLTYSIKGILLKSNEVLELENTNIFYSDISGVFDLPMVGGEALDIEHKYQMLTNGAEVTGTFLEGTFVISLDGEWWQLQSHFNDNPYSKTDEDKKERAKKPLYHPDNYYPAGGLPKDAVLVVRTEELRRFELSLSDESKLEKPLNTTERNTLLTIIAAMCKYESIDPKDRGTTSEIVRMTEDLGAPLSDDTIRSVLKKIPNAIESRTK
jgi:hypothetical protein